MHVVVRRYSGQGAGQLMDALEQGKEDVRSVITSVPGFVSYQVFRDDEGGTAVTVCENNEGAEESSRRAADWVRANVDQAVDPPSIAEGEAFIHF
jgi:hypothetical protein